MNGKQLLMAMTSATILIGGCAVVPVGDPYYYDAPVAYSAPPPPQYEYIGSPPAVGHLWIGGYWNWAGARYVWVPGRWEAPRHGHYWAPPRWEKHGDHWRQHGGRWERGDRPHAAPTPTPTPRFEHRAPPPAQTPHAPPTPRTERESRRPPEFDPGRAPERRVEPSHSERDNRNRRGRDDRRDRDRDGDGRPDAREGQRP